MAGFHPAAELVLHDMAVHTRFSVVSHVRIPACVDEGIRTDAYRYAKRHAEDDSTR